MLRAVTPYALLLAAGAFALQWLDFQRTARSMASELYVALVAAAFAAVGLWVGWRVAARKRGPHFVRNDAAVRALGLTRQELRVLEEVAAGRSNKEIGRSLGISPNTVKTHLANLFDKLEARRRTEVLGRARELELIP
jgi:DNA-binding CsgD family transcriptional regulator